MKLRSLAYTSLAILSVWSCSKDDDSAPTQTPEPKNQAPTISFISPSGDVSADGTLWNSVSIELNAEDIDGTVAKVELFINGTKETEFTSAPYTFDWDSKSVEDGTVELKATVTDNEGDATTEAITVNVMNVLLDYNLYDGFVNSGDNVTNFTYITGPAPEKRILYVAEITDGIFTETVQRPADFDGDTFDVHLLEFIDDDQDEGEITTFHNIGPGIFSPAPSTPTDFGSELGEANVTFTNLPEHEYSLIFSGGNTNPIGEGTERSLTIYEKFDLGYIYLRDGDKGHYLAVPFGVGNHDLLLDDMNTSMQAQTFTDDGANSTASLLVQGHTGPGRFSPAATVYRENIALGGNAFAANFHVPSEEDAVFDHYYTNARLQSDGKTFVHEAYYEVLTSMRKMDATFVADNKTMSELSITASSTDDFDFLNMRSQIAASDTFTFRWNSYSPDDKVSFPPIPTEVFEATNGVFNSSDIAFKDANITFLLEDRDNYGGYSDYRDIRFGRKTEDTERNERIYVFEIL
ncbi:MAG: Ig-like domain-containing protein [Bacteroidota bacterium]